MSSRAALPSRRAFRRAPGFAAAARGVGLIEVLIAVLILAIGLLGVAALQATALRNSQSSLQRSQGVVHVYSILDAMRANATAARGGAYNMGLTCAAPAGGSLVADDQRNWIQAIQQNLGPTACGQVSCAANVCTITVRWDDSRAGGASLSNYSISTSSRI